MFVGLVLNRLGAAKAFEYVFPYLSFLFIPRTEYAYRITRTHSAYFFNIDLMVVCLDDRHFFKNGKSEEGGEDVQKKKFFFLLLVERH